MSTSQEHTQKHHGGAHGSRSGSHGGHDGHQNHHEHMVRDFRQRFFLCLILTIPVVILSPMLQGVFGFERLVAFPGDIYVLFVLSSGIFFYGGWPFLKGLADEVGKRQPGMMTLISLAIAVAYVYSSLVAFGLQGRVFFWELASLIDVMLLGHWTEMRSVMSASGALQELVKLMPRDAHRLLEDGSTEDVSVERIDVGDRVLVRPGEKISVDGRVVDSFVADSGGYAAKPTECPCQLFGFLPGSWVIVRPSGEWRPGSYAHGEDDLCVQCMGHILIRVFDKVRLS